MPNYDPSQIANLVGQLGGDHAQAAQQLSNLGGQVDPSQHGDVLQNMGVDPQQLQSGGYDQHLNAQNDPSFQGYQSGGNLGNQNPQFGGQQGGQGQGGYGDQSQQGGQGGYGDQNQQGGGQGQQNY